MPAPTASWNLVRVYGTWRNMDGTLRSGTYTVTLPVRITNTTDNTIIPAGVYATGDLNTTEGQSSMSVMVPSTNDPDTLEVGWKVEVHVTFFNATEENYVIDVPYAARPSADGGNDLGVNLRAVPMAAGFPAQVAEYRLGEANGLALLDTDGDVINAAGGKVVGGGGGSVTSVNGKTGTVNLTHTDVGAKISSYVPTWTEVTSKPTTFTPATHTHPSTELTDSTATGRALISATDAATARAVTQAAPVTHTHATTDITSLQEYIQDVVGATLVSGTNVTVFYDDAANTITISSTGGGGGLDAEAVQDTIAAALVAGTNIGITYNDAANTITISTTATVNATDASLRDRTTHTGVQAISTITGLQTALDGKAASSHTHAVPADLVATGTPSATTYLRGDGTWATPAGGGGGGANLGAQFVNVKDHGAVGDGSTNDTAAILAARNAAGVGGTVYFPYSANAYMTDPIKPYSYQTWYGQHSPRYAWDNSGLNAGSVIRARAAQTAVFYNDNNTSNGVSTQAARGVTIRNLGIQGGSSFSGRQARGIDFGQMAGPERGWTIRDCSFNYCTTGIAGYIWVSTITYCHFSRNDYGIAPDQGLGGGRLNDSMISHNYLYFNLNHCISLAGASETGLCTIAFNRLERGGANVTGSATYDPTGVPSNTSACGIYISRATCVSIIGNSSDANAGPGLFLDAAAHGTVNNINSAGNIWKRDGIGTNDNNARLAGIRVKDTQYVQIRDVVTYGDPNDNGPGPFAPYYGLEYEANDWLKFDGSLQLDSGTTTRGVRSVGTANWMCSINDLRQPVMGFPAASTANAPTVGLQMGSAYYDTSLDTVRVWDGAAWDDMTGGGGGGGVTDHGALTGLSDDDHTLYALADGSRGNVRVIQGAGAVPGGTPAGTLIVRY